MDPVSAMMIAGGASGVIGNITGGIQRNRILKQEAARLRRNQEILQQQRNSQAQIGSMRLGEMLGQALMNRLGGGLQMSGSVLESEAQNYAFQDLTRRQELYQSDLQALELTDRLQDNSANRGGLFISTLFNSLGVAAETAGSVYKQNAKVPSQSPPVPKQSNWYSNLFKN